jgi:YhcH/YjgK/YiaL family protein
MIIDTLSNAEKYFCIHPLFAKAFEYIQSQNIDTIEVGKYEIDGDKLRAIVTNNPGISATESAAKFECHDKHIDIQFCINGKEQMGWKPRNTCTQQKSEGSVENDMLFYNDAPDMYFQLKNHQFAIFFPEDVHAPMIGIGDIKKILIKVRI